MRIDNIDKYNLGWLVGNFEPALLHSNDIEIGIKYINAGDPVERHYQKVATEYNYIVTGKVNANGSNLIAGDIFIYEPGEITELKILEDTTIVVIKTPSLGYDDKVVCDD